MLLEFKIPNNHIPIFYAVPLPGTKLYYDCLNNGKIKDEEEYLEKLSSNIEERQELYKDYPINISGVNLYNLVKWEKSLFLLIGLNRRFNRRHILFRATRKFIALIPANKIGILILSKFIQLIIWGRKVFNNLISKKQNE